MELAILALILSIVSGLGVAICAVIYLRHQKRNIMTEHTQDLNSSGSFIIFEDDGEIIEASELSKHKDRPILFKGSLKECQRMFDDWLESQQ